MTEGKLLIYLLKLCSEKYCSLMHNKLAKNYYCITDSMYWI